MCHLLQSIEQGDTERQDPHLVAHLLSEGLVSAGPPDRPESRPRYLVTRAGRRFLDDNHRPHA